MITQFFQLIGFMLIAGTKFLYAPTALYIAGYTFIESVIVTTIGGAVGVFVFYKLGALISRWWSNRFPPKVDKKKFTKKNRVFINFRNKYGLYGLAFVTPCIISIPIGCLLAAKYYHTDKKMIPLLLVSVVFWALALSSITYLIGPVFG